MRWILVLGVLAVATPPPLAFIQLPHGKNRNSQGQLKTADSEWHHEDA